jgi:glycosyltransferase involved in cell wall biosynthesis
VNKNICLVVNTLGEGGGIERMVLSLAQSLSKLNHRVHVIVLNKQESAFPLNNFNFNLHYIEQPKSPIKLICSIKQSALLKQKIVHIGIRFDLFIANSTYDASVCKQAKLPNLFHIIHNSLGNQHNQDINTIKFKEQVRRPFKSFYKILVRRFLYKFFIINLYNKENLIAVSQGVKKDLLKFGIQPKTIQIIYNPFDFSYIKKQSEAYKTDESNYIIHVGNFTLVKRYDILINAYKQSGIKQKLLLLGDHKRGAGKYAKQLVNTLNLKNQVIFKGFISNPFPYIKDAQALLLSSDQEGFGMVLVEALILNTPVISTNCISGPSEILIDELQPFLSPTGNAKKLGENIKRMVDNPVKITDKYISRFNDNKIAKQYLALCS